jgi:hypothetical protein
MQCSFLDVLGCRTQTLAGAHLCVVSSSSRHTGRTEGAGALVGGRFAATSAECRGGDAAPDQPGLVEADNVLVDDISRLAEIPDEPRFWLWVVDLGADRSQTMFGWQEARFVVRTVRGRKMHRVPQLFDEFAAALQFPAYFGDNWPAFDECLSDLEWLPSEAGYVLAVSEPAEVLQDSPADFKVLVRILGSAVMGWAMPVEAGEWWDRPPVPFNVVLATEPGSGDWVTDRWLRAGAHLARLGP